MIESNLEEIRNMRTWLSFRTGIRGLRAAASLPTKFSALSARDYFTSLSGMKYVAKVLLLYDVYEIPSVQFYDQEVDRLGYSVNGSLWTIASEIYCYILLLVLAALELIYLPIALFAL